MARRPPTVRQLEVLRMLDAEAWRHLGRPDAIVAGVLSKPPRPLVERRQDGPRYLFRLAPAAGPYAHSESSESK